MEILNYRCQICDASALTEIQQYRDFSRITSDCRPFGDGGQITACINCGGIQKLPSGTWRQEISKIYASYEAYYQAGGEEQIVLDASYGIPRPRSEVFLDRLREANFLNDRNSILDVGCGTGVTLRAINKVLPDAELNGYELTDSNSERLFKILGFKNLFVGDLEKIDSKFDLISLVHSLEHFPEPLKILRSLKEKLNPDGILFVEVCNADRNPFDLLIADHLMHFTGQTLSILLEKAGYEVLHSANDWISKELSFVAGVSSRPASARSHPSDHQAYDKVVQNLRWLKRFSDSAKAYAAVNRPFGIFGTSISATWIASEVDFNFNFFVDEDQSRVGKNYLGKSVLLPVNIPTDSAVFLSLVPSVARAINRRLSHLPVRFLLPPE